MNTFYFDPVPFPMGKEFDTNATNTQEQTALHLAAIYGNVAAIHTLIDQGADLEARDSHANTPLHTAIEYNQIDALKILYARGANPYAISDFGSPLHHAINKPDVEAVRIILDYPVDLYTLNPEQKTALQIAEEAYSQLGPGGEFHSLTTYSSGVGDVAQNLAQIIDLIREKQDTLLVETGLALQVDAIKI